MALPSIWNNDRVGDPGYNGFTLGGIFTGALLLKADYPNLRAIRLPDGTVVLHADLADNYAVPAPTAGLGYLEGNPVYYTTTGAATFVKASYPGLVAVKVECQGGGGGSGGAALTTATQGATGGGGGGGGYSRRIIPVANLAASAAIVVGAGGVAGAAGAVGGVGVASTFVWSGGTVSGGGGGAGTAGTATTAPNANNSNGGVSGVGAGGDFHVNGQRGQGGFAMAARIRRAIGGTSFLGRNTGDDGNSTGTAVGVVGGLYGCGAAGGMNVASQATAIGGAAGGAGIVIVTPLYVNAFSFVELLY